MTSDELFGEIVSYGIPKVEVVEFFKYRFLTVCDLSYDFQAALFDIDEQLYFEEVQRAAQKNCGWLLATT